MGKPGADRTECENSWFLRPLQDVDIPGQIEVNAEGVTIGRADTNVVVVPEEGFPYVSSTHCCVRLVDGAPVVEDLGSKNGTLVNGAESADGRLGNGDILQLGHMGPRFAVVCADQMR